MHSILTNFGRIEQSSPQYKIEIIIGNGYIEKESGTSILK